LIFNINFKSHLVPILFGVKKMGDLVLDVSDLLAKAGSKKEVELTGQLSTLHRGEEEINFTGPVKFNLVLENVSSGILARGFLSGVVNLLCSRCLANFDLFLKNEIEEIFYLTPQEVKKVVFEEREEQEILYVFDKKIDLSGLAKETFLLALPMKPLCSETCQGLCPKCGQDLNEGKCQCTVETGDLRLAELKKLLEP